MDVVIKNTAELKFEIARLQGLTARQELGIKQHFNSPRAILGTITSFFHKQPTATNVDSGTKLDISAMISKWLLPFTLNKTLFRKSGFLVKGLVTLLSRKAAAFVNDERIAPLWDKIKVHLPDTLVQKLTPKKRSLFYNLLSPNKADKQGN